MKTFFQDFGTINTTIDNIHHNTPESISLKIYGTVSYYWTILVANNIVNPFTDWVKTGQPFLNWINEKYKDNNGIDGIHHFFQVVDNRICDDYDDIRFREMLDNNETLPIEIMPITNLDYETDINNKNRQIVIISPNHIQDFVSSFDKMLTNKLN